MTSVDELTYSAIAKIAEANGYIILSKGTWDLFTRKLWNVAEENKRLKKINEKLRGKK